MFNYLTGFMPRKLKDLFRWIEYVYYNSPHIMQALEKMGDYVITDITFTTPNDVLRGKYDDLINKSMHGASLLKALSRDRKLYGNSFSSMYFPFKRLVPCSNCGSQWDIRRIGEYSFQAKDKNNPSIKFSCKNCGQTSATKLDDVVDVKIYDPDRINIIRWDPKQIDLQENPITGRIIYHYNIPAALKERIREGDVTMLNDTPKGFIRAALQDDATFEFDEGKIFHMKTHAPAGVASAWGFPSLMAVMKQFYYAEILRKANEAIAMDHLVPMRVLHPAQTSGSSDPAITISYAQWVKETRKSIKRWRQDPLHIMFAPVALGVTQMGGQGRTLMTLGEIKEAEDNIIAGLGVPREFLYGGLSYTGSSVTLRMLENQLRSHTADIKDVLQWMCDSIAGYMGWDTVEADITNFKFIDDIQQKQMMLQADASYNLMSRRTISETLDLDYDEEQDQIQQEALNQMRMQLKQDREMQKIQTSIAEQAAQEAGHGQGYGYDQQKMIADADMQVEQLMQMPYGERRSMLAQMQNEDFVFYSVVIQRLELAHQQSEQPVQ